jgi:hypothetical protein
LARFSRGTVVVTTPSFAGETHLIAAAMAALPVIQQVEQSLATRVANGVSAFFAPTSSGASGQNVPSQAASSPANSSQSSSAAAFSSSVASALLKLQDSSGAGQVHHHHHGAGKYKAASDATSQASDATSTSGSTSAATTPVMAVTA